MAQTILYAPRTVHIYIHNKLKSQLITIAIKISELRTGIIVSQSARKRYRESPAILNLIIKKNNNRMTESIYQIPLIEQLS